MEKGTIKTCKKNTFTTYQSISLDNSFNKDNSPSVSCFLKDDKIDLKADIKKKPLTIDTNSQHTILRFESLDTPCF